MDQDTHALRPTRLSRRLRWAAIGIIVTIVLLAAVASLLGYRLYHASSQQAVFIPADVVHQLRFEAYMPKKLPGNYRITPSSFSFADGVLIFAANDGTNPGISFTEQKVLSHFNFNDFYMQQLTDTKILDNVPYPSLAGKRKNDQATRVLSIRAKETWILISTRAPLDEKAMLQIAQQISSY